MRTLYERVSALVVLCGVLATLGPGIQTKSKDRFRHPCMLVVPEYQEREVFTEPIVRMDELHPKGNVCGRHPRDMLKMTAPHDVAVRCVWPLCEDLSVAR